MSRVTGSKSKSYQKLVRMKDSRDHFVERRALWRGATLVNALIAQWQATPMSPPCCDGQCHRTLLKRGSRGLRDQITEAHDRRGIDEA